MTTAMMAATVTTAPLGKTAVRGTKSELKPDFKL